MIFVPTVNTDCEYSEAMQHLINDEQLHKFPNMYSTTCNLHYIYNIYIKNILD